MRRTIGVIILLLIIGGLAVWAYLHPQAWGVEKAAQVMQQATDTTTTGKVKSAFMLSKRLSGYEIGIDTQNGVVTLNGVVPSEIDRELAENVTKDTNGVNQVVNRLQVEQGLKPSEASLRESARVADLEIRADLQQRLAESPELKSQQIRVAVQNRVVNLTGQVETPVQRNGAEQLARGVGNVVEVTNQLTVTNPAAAGEVAGLPPVSDKDTDLSKRASFSLFTERENFTDVGAIRVESKDGAVTLKGMVGSRAERTLAERLVKEVKDVQMVNNQLTIAPPALPN